MPLHTGDPNEHSDVNSVSLKLPNYLLSQPHIWFTQMKLNWASVAYNLTR